jgi:hypothetical protein
MWLTSDQLGPAKNNVKTSKYFKNLNIQDCNLVKYIGHLESLG